MTTKTQDFANATARAGKKKPTKKAAPAPKRKRGPGAAGTRNESAHAGKHGGAALEDTAGKATRKSTRKSSDGTKRTTSLQLKAQRKTTAPSTRAARGR